MIKIEISGFCSWYSSDLKSLLSLAVTGAQKIAHRAAFPHPLGFPLPHSPGLCEIGVTWLHNLYVAHLNFCLNKERAGIKILMTPIH